MDPDILAQIETTLGYTFTDRALLVQALTHSSFLVNHNDSLAWLGDRIHAVWAARGLYGAFPTARKGSLTNRIKELCQERAQAELFDALGLTVHLRVGGSVQGAGGRIDPSMKATAYEALVAAIELDGGPAAAEAFLDRSAGPMLAALVERDAQLSPSRVDPTSTLEFSR